MKKVHIVIPEIIGHIEPELYGHFSEHIGGVFYDGLWVGRDSCIPNIRGFRKDLIEKLRELHPPVLRWPGGCFAETYRWRDGIGKNRPVRPGWWTSLDDRYETNAVGTHEFLDLCELIGAKAYIAVNVTSITPLEARDWMDYCLSPRGSTSLALEREANGHPEPFDVAYWGIGNENWGGGGLMTADSYALEYRRFSTVLINLCGKRSKLIIGGANADDYAWTQQLIDNLSRVHTPMNGMSFHHYTQLPGQDQSPDPAGSVVDFTVDDWYDLLTRTYRMEEMIERHSAFTVGYGVQRKTRLVIDEWGVWHPDGSGPSKGRNLFEQQSTVRDAMVTAINLNLFNNHCDKIMMANAAQLVNNLHCCFLTEGEKCITTPTYHVFRLFRSHQDGDAVRVLIDDNGYGGNDIRRHLSASASVKDGILTLTLANCSCEDAMELDLRFYGLEGKLGNATMTRLKFDDIRAHNTFERPDAVTTETIPCRLDTPLILQKAEICAVTAELS